MSTQRTARRQLLLAAVAFAVIAMFLGMWTKHNHQVSAGIQLENGTLLPVPQDIAPFQLVNLDQQPFTKDSLAGHWNLIFFGFTRCPELCPTTLATLDKTYQILEHRNKVPMPQVVFISVDPERDNPDTIKNYLASFNKNFVGATGDKENLKQLTAQLNILFMKVQKQNNEDSNDYQIDHSGTILLVNPNAQLLAIFSTPHSEDALSHDVEEIEAKFRYQA